MKSPSNIAFGFSKNTLLMPFTFVCVVWQLLGFRLFINRFGYDAGLGMLIWCYLYSTQHGRHLFSLDF